jgi:DNA mismatch repair protein MutL
MKSLCPRRNGDCNHKGFVSKPEFAKKSRGEQFFFVNDRFIKSGYLHHAVMAAYEGILRDGAQPSYFYI